MTENPWATTLTAVDAASFSGICVALPTKEATFTYTISTMVSFVQRVSYVHLILRIDGEPALRALMQAVKIALKHKNINMNLEVAPR